ncbi:MAG: hypothetical protein GKS06_20485 [Acidobacteria bacterium]|nr:hypothetical protein [Acidobacteriota bacterium]
MRSFSGSHRITLTVVGLVVVLVLLAAMAWEAVRAATAQRATAEAVLSDYAQIAAEQYARGVQIALDYDWFLAAARDVDFTDGVLTAPPPETVIRTQAGIEAPLRAFASAFVLVDTEVGTMTAVDGWPLPSSDLTDALREPIAAANEALAGMAVWLPPDANGTKLAVMWPRVGRPTPVLMAELSIAEWVLESALDQYIALPAPFEAQAEVELVSLRVRTPGGRVLFTDGPEYDGTFAATQALGADRGGLLIDVAIPPHAAAYLVTGGVPGSRLPMIMGMFVAAVALLVGGVLLVRQERELMRLRERFVAGASHELRTPLAQIRMFAETLRLDRVRSAEERGRSLEILDREARRLSYLVDNLLHFSRPSPSSSNGADEFVDLEALAVDVIEGFQPLAAARSVEVRLNAHHGALVRVDRDSMRQVLLNMLDNATKYGPSGQTITVTIGACDGGRVALSVDDQGPGVPSGDRARVWERFWRGEGVNGTTGTGIGLSLVKELVESNGGEVAVEEAPGGGARFQVFVPGAA